MKCPGQDSRYWKPGSIFEAKCPNCGHVVEFFKDDTNRLCKKCGHRFVNPQMDFGCAAYCKYAEQCLGTLSPELLAQKENLLKDRVAVEMKRQFKKDFQKIGAAMRRARYAEQIGKEEGANLAVTLTAAYLYEMENNGGTETARNILARLGARESLIDEVCRMIARKDQPGDRQTPEFKAVHDATRIVRMEEKQKEAPDTGQNLEALLDTSFLTTNGRDLAKKVLSV